MAPTAASFRHSMLAVTAGALLLGCTVVPEVTYREATRLREFPATPHERRYFVALPASEVVIQGIDDESAAGVPLSQFGKKAVAKVVPVQGKTVLELIPKSSPFRTTAVSIAYRDDSLVPKSIGVKVEDHGVKIIEALGSIASLAAGGAAPMGQSAKKAEEIFPLPISLGPNDLAKINVWKKLPGQRHDKFRYRIEDDSKETDADEIGLVELTRLYGSPTSVFPVPGCKRIRLTICEALACGCDENKTKATFSLRIAGDAKKVRPYPLPASGSLQLHAACGASVVNEGASEGPAIPALGYIEAVLKARRAVLETGTDGKPAEKGDDVNTGGSPTK